MNINGVMTPGLSGHGWGEFETRWGFPESFEGKTLLDVGTYDGAFAFEAERRGAKVRAIDVEQNPLNPQKAGDTFRLAKELLGSNANYEHMDLLDETGQYDVVLCFGVLYHMVDVFRGIKKLAEITKEYCLIETACSRRTEDFGYFEVDPGREGDHTNVSYPNFKGLERMLILYGFNRVEMVHDLGPRFTIKATKINPQ
jgi:tRNA (mo5U34)-methyltransferase